MRLLHTESLELIELIGKQIPEYAILSHTWGDDELLFGDMQGGRPGLLASSKAGLGKVLKAASVAKENGFEYIWIDTCCIDKSSSAELSEAINSMFAWYSRAAVCYAYIADFDSGASQRLSRANRWFTRGWTLQELIAPFRVEFYDTNWVNFGDRARLVGLLSAITKMDDLALGWHRHLDCRIALATGRPGIRPPSSCCHFCRQNAVEMLESFSVATRMAWAANRTTTREEDAAYSLLGIFGVNMPLLYGEGPRAFLRLQHEIVRESATDHSIFAFTPPERAGDITGYISSSTWLFARSASWFAGGPKLSLTPDKEFSPTMTLTNIGVELELHLAPCKSGLGKQLWLAVLNCADVRDTLSSPAILLRPTQTSSRVRSFSRQMLRDRDRESLIYVTAGSSEVVSNTERVSFDTAMLKRETILLQDLQEGQTPAQGMEPRFIPPPSRVRLFGSLISSIGPTAPVFPTRHFVPPTLTVQARATDRLEEHSSADRPGEPLLQLTRPNGETYEDQAIVCGVAGFQLCRDDGIIVLWGFSRLPNKVTRSFSKGQATRVVLPEIWWGEYSGEEPLYTAVYPWTAPVLRDGVHHRDAMADEMTNHSTLQNMLDRCCAQGVPLKDATELICRWGRSCERTWTVIGDWEDYQRIKVSVTIEPVRFMGRRVMDIAVTFSPVKKSKSEGGAKSRLAALRDYFG